MAVECPEQERTMRLDDGPIDHALREHCVQHLPSLVEALHEARGLLSIHHHAHGSESERARWRGIMRRAGDALDAAEEVEVP